MISKLKITLFILLIFNISSYAQSSTFGKISYEKATNLSGKQRMLSQKIAKVLALKVAGAETSALKSEFIASKTLFERNLEILKVNAIKQSPKVRANLRNEISAWNDFKKITNNQIKDFQILLNSAHNLLIKCNNFVLAIEEESKYNKELSSLNSTDQLKVETVNKAGRQRMLSQKLCLYYVACRIFQRGKKADNACSNYLNLYNKLDAVVNELLLNELNTSQIEVEIAGILGTMDKIKSRKKEFRDNRISLQEIINITNSLTNQFNKITNLYSL